MTLLATILLATSAAVSLAAPLATAPGSAAAGVSGVQGVSSGEEILRTALAHRYPSVERWEIRAFGEGSADVEIAATKVVKLGARSALRVGKRLQWFAVSGFQKALVATRAIGAGQALGSETARLEEKDVIGAGCEPLTDVTSLNGMRSRRGLRTNDLICASAIEPRPAVIRGETVTVRYIGDRVTLVTKGIAQADGDPGELLPVRTLSSADSFRALVSGLGEVTVRE